MRIRVEDPTVLPDLAAELLRRVDTVVTQTGKDQLEVGLLGSRTTQANRAELEERLRTSDAARRTRVWVDEP